MSLSIIGGWEFNGNSNGVLGTYNGTDTSISYVAGNFGQCARLNGSSSFIDVGNVTQIASLNNFSFSGWVYFNSTAANQTITAKWDYQTQGCFSIQTLTSGAGGISIFIATALADPGTGSRSDAAGVITTGGWTHVCMTFDGTQTGNFNRLKLYINGVSVSMVQGLGAVPSFLLNASSTLKFGKWGGSLTRFLNADFDRFYIFNSTLSQGEVTQLYNGLAYPFSTGAKFFQFL